ncbi:ABC transporter, ATP-binding protein [Lentisphaera araneosa HTCC2155]|uniref:ABC transporter, ATP-binding protein n=1 Tax=Lentisphaera araneosa HTCC2155 TaxID=313628 RepID=A6DR48_9BACT|nr:ABC transporter, ATP-binding protein [Lentisphaera araneosa HTCC2155]
MEYIIKAEGLVKEYKKKRVVKGVSFKVEKGQIVGLLGPNGAGKTTSFYMVVGLVRPEEGKVLFNGENVTKLPMYKRARMGMGYLAQEPSVFRRLTVKDNIMAILEMLKLDKAERVKRMHNLIDELGLEKVADQAAVTLSGGERRRLEIARALVTNPTFLMLDEPFAGVDPIAVSEVQKIIRRLKDRGISILITDHSVRDMLSIVDYGYIMNKGELLTEGTSDFLVSDKEAREIYLGSDFEI